MFKPDPFSNRETFLLHIKEYLSRPKGRYVDEMLQLQNLARNPGLPIDRFLSDCRRLKDIEGQEFRTEAQQIIHFYKNLNENYENPIGGRKDISEDHELREVKASATHLERLEPGDRLCWKCSQAIPKLRLKELPDTQLCHLCADQRRRCLICGVPTEDQASYCRECKNNQKTKRIRPWPQPRRN